MRGIEIDDNPVILIEFKAQIKFSSISLFPSFKSYEKDSYNMGTSDRFCESYNNRFLITITDVDDKTFDCTSLQGINFYQESTCGDAEG